MPERVDLIIAHAGELVTHGAPGVPARGALMRPLVIRDGAVAIRDGRCVGFGVSSFVRRSFTARRTLDATGKVVTPGLVDAHTHVAFAGSRIAEFEMRARGASYEEIAAAGGGILSSVRATRAAGTAGIVRQTLPRLRQMLASGTTTAEVKSGYCLDPAGEIALLRAIRRLNKLQPITLIPTLLGAHAVPPEYRARRNRYVETIVGRMIPAAANLARFCDVFCEPGYFSAAESRRILQAGRLHGLLPKIHADEFSRSGGAALAVRIGAISADHLGAIDASDIRALAASDTVSVLLPGTLYTLGKRRLPPARRLIDSGAAVALGTDCNPGTNLCTSLPATMNQACVMLGMSPTEALLAATCNSAHAVGEGDSAGSIAGGRWADLVLWDTDDHRRIAYEYGASLASVVLKRGRVVWSSSTFHPSGLKL